MLHSSCSVRGFPVFACGHSAIGNPGFFMVDCYVAWQQGGLVGPAGGWVFYPGLISRAQVGMGSEFPKWESGR